MRLVMSGLSHQSAPLAIRETLAVSRAALPDALAVLRAELERGVVLSTCNRTEVYTVAGNRERAVAKIGAFLRRQFGVDPRALAPHLYVREQEDAARHLFRVACGLDSLIVGESEVLGQVREAYSAATRHGTAGGALARLFHQALRVGKRARTETAIGRNALSVSRASVELSRRVLGDLRGLQGLVVGTGDAGRLTAQALHDAGLTSLTIANRTREHAEEMAAELDARVASLGEMPDLLATVDVVVSSAGAPDFLITHDMVRQAMIGRSHQPLFAIDIAMPRDIDPAAGSVAGVHLHTTGDLELLAEANRQERKAEARKVEAIVVEEVEHFRSWWQDQSITPTIAAIRHQAETLRASEVRRLIDRLPELTPAAREKVESMSRSLISKLLHDPTRALRSRQDQELASAARTLFGVGPDGDGG